MNSDATGSPGEFGALTSPVQVKASADPLQLQLRVRLSVGCQRMPLVMAFPALSHGSLPGIPQGVYEILVDHQQLV